MADSHIDLDDAALPPEKPYYNPRTDWGAFPIRIDPSVPRDEIHIKHIGPEEDNSGFSGHTINGAAFTWMQIYEREHEECIRLGALASMLQDLDRCEHGRHQKDSCFSCVGQSKGNLFAQHFPFLGFNLSGDQIVYPTEGNPNDPANWIIRRPSGVD